MRKTKKTKRWSKPTIFIKPEGDYSKILSEEELGKILSKINDSGAYNQKVANKALVVKQLSESMGGHWALPYPVLKILCEQRQVPYFLYSKDLKTGDVYELKKKSVPYLFYREYIPKFIRILFFNDWKKINALPVGADREGEKHVALYGNTAYYLTTPNLVSLLHLENEAEHECECISTQLFFVPFVQKPREPRMVSMSTCSVQDLYFLVYREYLSYIYRICV